MTALQRFLQIAAAVKQYGAIATEVVAQVQQEVGPSNGDAKIQQSKKQLAVTYILAAAHAGEAVPVPQVALIATVVEMVVQVASALGHLGKAAAPTATVTVPSAPVSATAAA